MHGILATRRLFPVRLRSARITVSMLHPARAVYGMLRARARASEREGDSELKPPRRAPGGCPARQQVFAG